MKKEMMEKKKPNKKPGKKCQQKIIMGKEKKMFWKLHKKKEG